MGGIDSTTWFALGLALTLLGLLLSVWVWRRRGPASGLRAVAWSLLPLAAGMTGVLRLAADVADAVSSWALRLVFSPLVWLGVVVAGMSVVLFVVSGVLRRRGGTTAGRPARAVEAGKPKAAAEPALDDDIEAILKRHGIS